MTIPRGGILIGYARYSTDEQDLTAQRPAEQDPDLEPDRSPRRAASGSPWLAGMPMRPRRVPRRGAGREAASLLGLPHYQAPPSGSFRSDLDVRASFFERFDDAIP